jgi:hypothetical protein
MSVDHCHFLFQIFSEIFGFSKDGFRQVLDLVLPDLTSSRHKNPSHLTPVQKLCIFLDFLRTNSFHRTVGTQHHVRVHQSKACRIINYVAECLARHVPMVNILQYRILMAKPIT